MVYGFKFEFTAIYDLDSRKVEKNEKIKINNNSFQCMFMRIMRFYLSMEELISLNWYIAHSTALVPHLKIKVGYCNI